VIYTLRKNEILRGRKAFLKISSSNNKLFEQNIFCCYEIENTDTTSDKVRVGFIVSKKNGNAVIRNRIKRLMRESYRLSKHIVFNTPTKKKFAVSIIFIYTKNNSTRARNLKLAAVKYEIEQLLIKLQKTILLREPV
jgi:ribonuclease P protein component